MLSSPSAAVVGSTDLEASVSFYETFGFEVARRWTLDEAASDALFGLDRECKVVDVAADATRKGWIRLVSTSLHAAAPDPYERGAHALDVYTRDIDESISVVERAGYEMGERGTIDLGPLVMRQIAVHGPDGELLVLVDANKRRPSILDTDDARLHSEVHSFLWAVDSIEDAAPFWRKAPGLDELHVFPINHPAVPVIMALPRPDAPIKMNLIADPPQDPIRFELLEFPEDPGPTRHAWPLTGGLHCPLFEVSDVHEAMAALIGAHFGPLAAIDSREAVSGVAPGGVRFQLWSAP